jgi:SPW repeat-containing protein
MISPFVLELVNRRAFQVGWEDFLLGLGIATFSLCRLASRRGAALWDFMIMALGLTTLLNPIVFHYFNVKVVAWNNLLVGSMVLILAIYEDRKDSESSGTIEGNHE